MPSDDAAPRDQVGSVVELLGSRAIEGLRGAVEVPGSEAGPGLADAQLGDPLWRRHGDRRLVGRVCTRVAGSEAQVGQQHE